jgi:ribosomal protein S24E
MDNYKDIRNELFKRQEISFEIESPKNPSFAEVRKQISEKTGKSEETVDVFNIIGNFGKNKFKVGAYVYDSKEDLNSIQKIQMTKKQKDEAKKAEEEAKKAEEEAKKEAEKPVESDNAPVEEKAEQVEEKLEEKSSEAPEEDRPEEEQKASQEDAKKEEEAKE